MRKSLQEIGVSFGCGKMLGHSYSPVYEEMFGHLRDKELNLLELGVDKGDSLKTWLEYFTEAHIYGIDSGPPVEIHDPRCFQYQCPCHEEQVGRLFQSEFFDVIIDDCSHQPDQQQASCRYLWHTLKRGAMYFVEDIFSSTQLPYWATQPGFKVWAEFKDCHGHFRDDDILVMLVKP